jgi:hypothetical protein
MQLRIAGAFAIILLVSFSLSAAGCLFESTNPQPTTSPIPSTGESYNARSIFCNNTTLQAFVKDTYAELVNRFGNSPTTLKRNDAPRLDGSSWRFSGNYLVLEAVSQPYCKTAEAMCISALNTYSIRDPKSLDVRSDSLTVFYLIPYTKDVGFYYPGGPEAKETSYRIFVVKYPEKQLLGTDYLASPSAPKTIHGGLGGHVYADYYSWIESYHTN